MSHRTDDRGVGQFGESIEPRWRLRRPRLISDCHGLPRRVRESKRTLYLNVEVLVLVAELDRDEPHQRDSRDRQAHELAELTITVFQARSHPGHATEPSWYRRRSAQ